jgi:hypothetical protein
MQATSSENFRDLRAPAVNRPLTFDPLPLKRRGEKMPIVVTPPDFSSSVTRVDLSFAN